MPHYLSLTGEHLKLLLMEFGFHPTWEGGGRVTMFRESDSKIRSFTTAHVIPLWRIEVFCKALNISAEEFNEKLRLALAKARPVPKSVN